MKPFIPALVSLLLLATTAAADAQDPVPEKAAVCAACHGEGGAKPILPEYPVLAGQYANYLEYTLRGYKAGTRRNAVMNAQAAGLSDTEIKVLARYFASQNGALYTPSIEGKVQQ